MSLAMRPTIALAHSRATLRTAPHAQLCHVCFVLAGARKGWVFKLGKLGSGPVPHPPPRRIYAEAAAPGMLAGTWPGTDTWPAVDAARSYYRDNRTAEKTKKKELAKAASAFNTHTPVRRNKKDLAKAAKAREASLSLTLALYESNPGLPAMQRSFHSARHG